MPARYSALPRSVQDADTEMEAAFASDDEHDGPTALPAPVTMTTPAATESRGASVESMPGSYDFEQVYDYDYPPPPGDPPRPSAFALPNSIGNSNGLLPSQVAVPHTGRPSFLRRALAAAFPSRYTLVPPSEAPRRIVGGGIENDGVFANVMAKPTSRPAAAQVNEDGIYVVPEETQKEPPPSYAVAQADAVPPYWETTVLAPLSGAGGDMIVEGLPTGSVFAFLWNVLVSFSFNFVGFLLTYLLHTSHASKYGSRAGLGITLLQYGFALRNHNSAEQNPGEAGWLWEMPESTSMGDPTSSAMLPTITPAPTGAPAANSTISSGMDDAARLITYPQDWIAFFLMTIGWFLLLTSVLGYWRVKRWEREIRSTSVSVSQSEILQHDRAIRRNLERVFGLGGIVPMASPQVEWDPEQQGARRTERQDMSPEEDRLARDLRNAGLL